MVCGRPTVIEPAASLARARQPRIRRILDTPAASAPGPIPTISRMTTTTARPRAPHRSPAASLPDRVPQQRRGPGASQRATIFLLVLGITLLVSVLAQFGWAIAMSQGMVTTAVGSLVATHLVFGTLRVLVGAWLSVTAMHRAFGCRPTWRLALGAHAAGVLVSKTAVLGAPAAVSALLLLAGLALPAYLFVRRAG